MPDKGFALPAAGQFATHLQEFGLWPESGVPSLMAADKLCPPLQISLIRRGFARFRTLFLFRDGGRFENREEGKGVVM